MKNQKIELVKSIVKEVDKNIKRIYWTNEQIDRLFAKRNAREILESKNTCFMNPCSDFTLTSSFLMNQSYIPHKWVVEQHFPSKEFDFFRLHFLLEFEENNETYVLNYKKANEVYIYNGKYNGRKDLISKEIIRIPSEEINLKKSLYENIFDSNLTEKIREYSLEKNLERLKKDNSVENFENFKKLYGNHFKIFEKYS